MNLLKNNFKKHKTMKLNVIKSSVVAGLCILTITFAGCKAKPIGDSGFIKNPEMMKIQ